MTNKFYKTHNQEYFKGRQAFTNRDLKNKGGDFIGKGSLVDIDKRYGGFHIRLSGTKIFKISRVPPDDLELSQTIEQYENNPPQIKQ